MSGGVDTRQDRRMSSSNRVTVGLHVDLSSDPIEGEVQTRGGSSHPFSGWLGLTAALERAAGGEEQPFHPQEKPHVQS